MENKYYNENYYNANTILKFLRKVLNEINKSYVDSGMRTAFLMKRYLEKYKLDTELSHQHVLLCMLKDIGLFYMDGAVPTNDPALAAASSYAFLHQCSPLGEAARPLLFYKAKYMEDVSNPDYEIGLLMTLLDQVSLYIYERKDIEEIEEILREDKRKKKYHPDQVKKVIKLLKDHSDIIEKLNSESELYVYETSKYISLADYGTDTLGEFLDTTSFMFEFHNHETMAHTVTTAQIAYDLAISCKLTESTSRAIEIAGKVHDIGKIRVPLEILCYPGKLEGEALAVMQSHAKYTKEIIEGCFSYVIVEIAARHHEKLDGSGYPLGITKKDLTSADKVLAVADICSALYCKRSYKAAFTPEKIQSILLSDAKAGKLDERIVNHLIDDYDNIMKNAKAVEDIALKKYDTMKDEYEALAKSPALRHVFGESEDIDEERPESVAADETEEYISGVINYESKKDDEEVAEKIIYVDENGNEIDYTPEAPSFEASYEEEKEIDPLEEYNQAEMGDVPIEEIDHEEEDEVIEEKEEIPLPIFNLDEKLEEEPIQDKVEEEKEDIDDEFDAFLNSIPEKEEEEPKKFVPKVPLKNPMMDFDPFKEDIDPVFQEPILPKEETKEDIDDEFDAFLNSIPEIDEKNDSSKESIDSKEKLEDVEEAQEKEEEKEEVVEALVEEKKEEIDTVEEAIDRPIDIEAQEEKEEDSTEDTEESASSDIESEEVDDAIRSDEDEVDDSTLELDTLTEESNDEEIDSKYDDLDEEVDNFIEEDQKEEKEESSFIDPFNPSDDGKKSFFDEEDTSDLEFNDEEIDSKYDNDEEVDDSIEDIEESDEEDALDDSKEEPIDSFDLDIEDDSINNEEENLLINSKYDDLDEEIDGSDSILEDEESKEEDNSKDASKEEEYVDSYFTEEELNEDEEPKELSSNEESLPKEENKEEEYVSSYFTEEELKEDEEVLSKEDIKPIKEEDPKVESDGELDMDFDEDDEDEDDEEEEEDLEEEEDSNPKHKKFFSNDIYRKMFTYNPNKKKK